jgi:hypothetical protein
MKTRVTLFDGTTIRDIVEIPDHLSDMRKTKQQILSLVKKNLPDAVHIDRFEDDKR